jgi:inosine/xanthosine triphosphatase
MQIVVASTNPVKIQAGLEGFKRMFPDQSFTAGGISVPSGVSDQPMSDAETLLGATNRVQTALDMSPDAAYGVGIEGGCEEIDGQLHAFAWVVVLSREHPDIIGKSRTATFILPEEVASLLRQGVELGHADDQVFGRSNSKQQNGAVGLLTDDLIDRAAYYEHAVILALIPFRNLTLDFKKK